MSPVDWEGREDWHDDFPTRENLASPGAALLAAAALVVGDEPTPETPLDVAETLRAASMLDLASADDTQPMPSLAALALDVERYAPLSLAAATQPPRPPWAEEVSPPTAPSPPPRAPSARHWLAIGIACAVTGGAAAALLWRTLS